VREAIEAVDPDPSGAARESLSDLVDAFVAFVTDQSPVARIYVQLAVGRGLTDPAVAARVTRSHRHRLERFAEAWSREDVLLSSAEAEHRAVVTLSALMGMAVISLLDPAFDIREHTRRLAHGGEVAVGHGGRREP